MDRDEEGLPCGNCGGSLPPAEADRGVCPRCAAATWRSILPEDAPRLPSRRFLIIAAEGAALVAIALVVFFLSRGGREETPPPALPATAAIPAPEPAEPTFKEETTRLDKELDGPWEREQFGDLLDRLEEARSRRGDPEWAAGIDGRVLIVRQAVHKRWAELVRRARDAKKAGRTEASAKIRERVAGWGMKPKLEDFDRVLADVKPPAPSEPARAPPAPVPRPAPLPEPPRPVESPEYVKTWEAAAVHATLRDYDRAVQELEEVGGKETDVVELKRVGVLYTKLLRKVAARPRGRDMAIEARHATGERRKVEGRLVEAGKDRVEIEPGPGQRTVFVELADATAGSLLALAEGDVADDAVAAAFCFLDGDALAAERWGTGSPKLRAYAGRAWSRVPPVDALARREEMIARRLFYEAEREHRLLRTRGAAVEKYATLQEEYIHVPFVIRAIDRIAPRVAAAGECWYLPSDLRGGGSFHLEQDGAMGSCWKSSTDSDRIDANLNTVEIGFTALAGETWRCWALVGGCCGESFTGYVQATGKKAPSPIKSGETVRLEPGSDFGLPLRVPLGGLKETHAEHARGQPKSPQRWKWVRVEMPHYTSGGAQRVRILTADQGFSVARALVSARRTEPPDDKERRELDAARERERPLRERR